MAQYLRRLVSQNKQRHVERVGDTKFDLDLTYLTEQIICMALPATGPESIYRNPIESIAKFLEHHHAGKYKVFNLCNERQYDISAFQGACATFPFDDHGCPPIEMVVAFCQSAKSWLLGGLDHVVAIHCKAGKGRTGLMSCCLLMHLGWQTTAEKAIDFYNCRRTKDGRGLTQPSQRRYVRYYEKYLHGDTAGLDEPRTLGTVQLLNAPTRRPRLRVRFVNHAEVDAEVKARSVTLDANPEAVNGAAREALGGFALRGDVRVEVHDDASSGLLCRLWMHVRLEASETRFVLTGNKMTSDVEVIDKGGLPGGFTIVLHWMTVTQYSDGASPPLSAADLATTEAAAKAVEAPAEAAAKAVEANASVAGVGGASQPAMPPHPAVDEPWKFKEEAIRVFKLGDADGNGSLDMQELKEMLKNPQYAESVMENLDTDLDGTISEREWLIAMKSTFDKSEAACKTALKAHEKAIASAKEKKVVDPLVRLADATVVELVGETVPDEMEAVNAEGEAPPGGALAVGEGTSNAAASDGQPDVSDAEVASPRARTMTSQLGVPHADASARGLPPPPQEPDE